MFFEETTPGRLSKTIILDGKTSFGQMRKSKNWTIFIINLEIAFQI